MSKCEICGREFEKNEMKYCSRACARKALKAKELEKIRKKWKDGKQLTINEVNELALQEHMTYGQFVGKYGV